MTAALSFVLMCYARMGSMNRADMVITPDSPAVRAYHEKKRGVSSASARTRWSTAAR